MHYKFGNVKLRNKNRRNKKFGFQNKCNFCNFELYLRKAGKILKLNNDSLFGCNLDTTSESVELLLIKF